MPLIANLSVPPLASEGLTTLVIAASAAGPSAVPPPSSEPPPPQAVTETVSPRARPSAAVLPLITEDFPSVCCEHPDTQTQKGKYRYQCKPMVN